MSKINHDIPEGKLDHCQITGSEDIFEAIDLGHQPPCDSLLTEEMLRQPEVTYPLRLMISKGSGLGQLDYAVDGAVIYPNEYPYRAGISKPLQDYLLGFSDDLQEQFNTVPESLCVDVGCNDGTLLSGFVKYKMRTVGIEPTNMAQFAKKENDIETIQDFFTESVAKDITKKHGKAKVITMTNVFAHMITLGEVMRGISELLDKDGIFVTESQYLLDVLLGNQFDQVYHEHIRIYSVKSLVTLFPHYGMEVFDAKRVGAREGSIRVYVGWKGQHSIHKRVKELLDLEKEKGLFKPETWAKWREDIQKEKEKMMKFLYKAKREGKTVVADSCPGRGAVLVNYYGIDHSLIPYISQLPESEKVGKYLPGTHIPIVDNEVIMREKPDYIVILAWHYGDYIIKNWKKKGLKSKFIMPLPKFEII
ncbi:MAG: class I SAM-dependent methyltransferase [Candidatus Pacebacteria bacterium]|nr:class I SAM-dependent methyltransferase [Candidatus Paceibacterota bacterium]